MAPLLRLAMAIGCCMSLFGTQVSAQNLMNGQCVQNYDPNTDYFPDKIHPSLEGAVYYEIEYHNNYKIVTDHRSQEQYYLVQCGTPIPAVPNNTEIYSVPVTSVAAVETTVVTYLEMLGVATSIDLIADAALVTSSCFQKFVETATNLTQISTTNSSLADIQADAVQVMFGTSYYTTAATDDTVENNEAFEPDVLGRASWIGYYAAFYNLESLANKILTDMKDNYNRLTEASSHYSEDKKPLVAWTLYDEPNSYNGNVASWNVSKARYKAQLVEDAGARMPNLTQEMFFNRTEFLNAITDVDVIVDETYISSTLDDFMTLYGITEDMSFKFIENKAVYRLDGTMSPAGGVDWFAAGIVMVDAVLEDVINAVNPSAPSPDYKRSWLRNIAKNETVSYVGAGNCTYDENAPRPNLAITYTGGAFTLSSAALPAVSSNWVLVSAALLPIVALLLH